jgi:hypothetical protein
MHQMDESPDDPKPPKAPDDPGIQTRPARPLGVDGDDAGPGDRPIRRPPFPSLILAAGVLWLIAAAIDLCLLALCRVLGLPLGWTDLLLAVAAALTIRNAALLLRGRHGAPLKAGAIFALLGLYFLTQALSPPDLPPLSALAFVLFDGMFGLLSLASGVLLMLGSRAYHAWVRETAEARLMEILQRDLDATEDDREETPRPVNPAVRKASGWRPHGSGQFFGWPRTAGRTPARPWVHQQPPRRRGDGSGGGRGWLPVAPAPRLT